MSFPLKAADRRPKAPEALLVALLRGVPMPAGAAKCWPEVLDLAVAHGVAPLLHAIVPDLPGEARERLRKVRAAALADRGWQYAALLRVQGALEGVGAIVIHAAAHAEDLYPAPELRPHAGIDLLIAPSRTFSALERLSRRGYQIDAQAPRPGKGWLRLRLRDPRDARVEIDLHRGFARPGTPTGVDGELRSALNAESLCARASVARLSADDAVLVHALELGNAGLRVPLAAVVDLAHLFGRCVPGTVVARARQVSLLPDLATALLLLEKCLGASSSFGGAAVAHGRIPRLEVPQALAQAVDRFELEAEGRSGRPGPLLQLARTLLGAVAERGRVE